MSALLTGTFCLFDILHYVSLLEVHQTYYVYLFYFDEFKLWKREYRERKKRRTDRVSKVGDLNVSSAGGGAGVVVVLWSSFDRLAFDFALRRSLLPLWWRLRRAGRRTGRVQRAAQKAE
jgi:hypothetical protein